MSTSDVITSVPFGVSTDEDVEKANMAALHRLSIYIGPNWRQHYEPVFTRLLAENRIVGRRRWTWNWAAALTPFWFLYRRLYGPFFFFLGAFTVTRGLGAAVSANSEGDQSFLLLNVVQHLVQGWVADRLLYKEATLRIQEQPPLEDAKLVRRGKPNREVLLSIVAVYAVFVLYFLARLAWNNR
jgi:hypothetical protein